MHGQPTVASQGGYQWQQTVLQGTSNYVGTDAAQRVV